MSLYVIAMVAVALFALTVIVPALAMKIILNRNPTKAPAKVAEIDSVEVNESGMSNANGDAELGEKTSEVVLNYDNSSDNEDDDSNEVTLYDSNEEDDDKPIDLDSLVRGPDTSHKCSSCKSCSDGCFYYSDKYCPNGCTCTRCCHYFEIEEDDDEKLEARETVRRIRQKISEGKPVDKELKDLKDSHAAKNSTACEQASNCTICLARETCCFFLPCYAFFGMLKDCCWGDVDADGRYREGQRVEVRLTIGQHEYWCPKELFRDGNDLYIKTNQWEILKGSKPHDGRLDIAGPLDKNQEYSTHLKVNEKNIRPYSAQRGEERNTYREGKVGESVLLLDPFDLDHTKCHTNSNGFKIQFMEQDDTKFGFMPWDHLIKQIGKDIFCGCCPE